MIFKGRREKSIEPPNQTTLKHLLVESPCISLTSKPAPFFGTWLRSLALCLVSDLGRSEDRPPPNSETLPSKMCVYVYQKLSVNLCTFLNMYLEPLCLLFCNQQAFFQTNSSSQTSHPDRVGRPPGEPKKKNMIPSWAQKMNLKNREQMDWFSSIEFTPLLCFEQLQGPPNTINNPSPNLPHQHLGPRDIQRLCSSIKASKLNMTTKPQGRKELQLTSTSTTFLPAKPTSNLRHPKKISTSYKSRVPRAGTQRICNFSVRIV